MPRTIIAAIAVAVVATLAVAIAVSSPPGLRADLSPADLSPATAPTLSQGLPAATSPGTNAMTVYAVSNPNAFGISVHHIITNTAGFRHEFASDIPANSTIEYHLRDIAAVPSPFSGTMTLQSDQQFTAEIVGYDYPQSYGQGATPAGQQSP